MTARTLQLQCFCCLSFGRLKTINQKIIKNNSMKKNSNPNPTVTNSKWNWLSVTAFIFALISMNQTLSNLISFAFSGLQLANDSDVDDNQVTAESLTENFGPISIAEVTDVKSFLHFISGSQNVTLTNIVTMLVTGKSTINLLTLWKTFSTQFVGTPAFMFYKAVYNTIELARQASTSSIVLDYVQNATIVEMRSGYAMITVRGNNSLNVFEGLAIKALLMEKYPDYKGYVITFNVPGLRQLVPMLGNQEKTDQFIEAIYTSFTDVERQQNGNGLVTRNQNVITVTNSNTPADVAAKALNDATQVEFNRLGDFVSNESLLNA